MLTERARARGWAVHHSDAKTVERDTAQRLGVGTDAVLRAPRAQLGPPWSKDHRMALAATIVSAPARA